MIPNLIFILRRRWLILLIVPLLTTGVVIALSPRSKPQPVRYEITVYLAGDPEQTSPVALEQAAVAMRQADVAKEAARIMDEQPEDYRVFAKQLKTKVDPDSLTIKMSATDPSKERVAKFVRSFAEAYITISEETRNENYMADLQALRDEQQAAEDKLNLFLEQNKIELQKPIPDPSVLSSRAQLQARVDSTAERVFAKEEEQPTSPYEIQDTDPVTRVADAKLQLPSSRPVRAVLAFMLGVLGAIALAAFVEKLNPRIDSPGDAERIVGAPVLAMVPIMKGKRRKIIERADLSLFSGPFAESFRAMRSHLDFRSGAEGLDRPPAVMIVSSAPGEGKTTSAAFLGLSYAEVGREVVVVGGDFRRPAVHRLFGVPRAPGLSSRLLANDTSGSAEDVVRSIVKRDERTGVRVIPSGPGTDRVTGLLGDLAAVTSAGLDSGCTVVIDTAPVMVANDAIDFLPLVDWVIIVVRLGRTTERSLRQTIASLELNNARVVGCVMVGSLESSDAKRYYYSYYKVDDERDEMSDQLAGVGRRPAAAADEAPAPAPAPTEDAPEAAAPVATPPERS